jgi:hypothetical protein
MRSWVMESIKKAEVAHATTPQHDAQKASLIFRQAGSVAVEKTDAAYQGVHSW